MDKELNRLVEALKLSMADLRKLLDEMPDGRRLDGKDSGRRVHRGKFVGE